MESIGPPRGENATVREPHSAHVWGYVPYLAVTTSLGLLIIAAADAAARQSAEWATAAFWIGIIAIFLPGAIRLSVYRISYVERASLLALITLAVYLVKVLHSPVTFTFTDEFQHYRTLSDILTTNHLYAPNPLSLTSPAYPGLEIIAHALITLGGIPTFTAGLLVIGGARLVLVFSLFGVYEQISRSARFASLGALLYMANFNYVFWSAQFIYESLALPLAVFVIYILVVRLRASLVTRTFWLVVASLVLAALVSTHHLTMFWLFTVLVAWAICAQFLARFGKRTTTRSKGPGTAIPYKPNLLGVGLAATIIIMILVMLAVQAPIIIYYVRSPLIAGLATVAQAFSEVGQRRQIFQGFAPGVTTPTWEQILAVTAMGLTLLCLILGFWLARQRRIKPLILLLMLIAMIYPVTLPLRLAARTWEIANRSSDFAFIGLAFVLAYALNYIREVLRKAKLLRLSISAILTTFLLVGGIISGWPIWARLPGPYLVSAETRSVDSVGMAAARWTLDRLGSHNPILGDRTSSMLMGSYGKQDVVTFTNANVSSILLSPAFDNRQRELLQHSGTQFVTTDNRLTTQLPLIGFYVDASELDGLSHTTPVDPGALRKFDESPLISRLFDNGHTVIYDMRIFNGHQ